MKRNNLPAKGRAQGRYGPAGDGLSGGERNNLDPFVATCNNLENGQIAEEDQSCNNRNNLSLSKGLEEGGKIENRGIGVNNRPEVVTVVTGGFVHLTVEGAVAFARKDQRAKLVAVNETGDRIGEGHKNAVLTDAQVDEIRDRFEAYETGHPKHEGYRVLAKAYNVGKRTIRDIVHYRKRNVWPAKWKRVTTD